MKKGGIEVKNVNPIMTVVGGIALVLVMGMASMPKVVSADEALQYHGAGNCKCAKLTDCPTGCTAGKYISSCEKSPTNNQNDNCTMDTNNNPCGTGTYSQGQSCAALDGGTYDCTVP